MSEAEDNQNICDAVYVRLSQRKWGPRFCTLIDREDFERVTKSKWYYNQGYAVATCGKYLPRHHERLHAFILKAQPGQIIDHISGDRLDNRKQNLRIVTRAENAKNAKRPTFPGKTSRFKGVCWSKYDGKWLAAITSDGVRHDLGLFDEEVAAALEYDKAAKQIHGEFARTNADMRLYVRAIPYVPNCARGAKRSCHVRAKPSKEPWHEYNNRQIPPDVRATKRLLQEIEKFGQE